ncbi:hypothetical protein FQN54_008537 [Arachnomyces sp. PD_36]|nr:hypothetical protein FQN54_008537 [Arachnomyces sp. PD_36]
MSTSTLKENGLYICLFIRNDPPLPNDFHWALYHHHTDKTGGMKYHITGSFKSGWLPGHEPNSGIMKSFLLVGLFQIGYVPVGLNEFVDRTFRAYDEELNYPDVTCRVWVWRVLALLRKSVDGATAFKCEDIEALEREVMEWGNQYAEGASKNLQPRPVDMSAICGL